MNVNLWQSSIIKFDDEREDVRASGYIGELNCANLIRIRPSHRRYWIDILDERGKCTITKVMNTNDNQDIEHGEGAVLLDD